MLCWTLVSQKNRIEHYIGLLNKNPLSSTSKSFLSRGGVLFNSKFSAFGGWGAPPPRPPAHPQMRFWNIQLCFLYITILKCASYCIFIISPIWKTWTLCLNRVQRCTSVNWLKGCSGGAKPPEEKIRNSELTFWVFSIKILIRKILLNKK